MHATKGKWVLFLYITVLSALLFLFSAFPRFAAGFDAVLGAPIRAGISALSGIVPFSMTELLLLLLLPLVPAVVSVAFRARRPFSLFLCFLLPYVTLFVLTFSAGRYRPPLEETLGLDTSPPSAEELLGCAEWLSALAAEVPSPPEEEALALRLSSALAVAGEHYGIPVNRAARPKMTCTPLLTSLGYFGLYAFPLGEVTVAAECPPSVGAFTAAHELAHASGLLREEEADAFALLLCLDSRDPYLIYAAATGMLGRLLTALEEVDRGAWTLASEGIPATVRQDLLGAGEVMEEEKAPVTMTPGVPYGDTVLLLCGIYRAFR